MKLSKKHKNAVKHNFRWFFINGGPAPVVKIKICFSTVSLGGASVINKENKLRLAVLSDVHGNLPALEAVLDDLACRGIDRIIFAGDFIGGPQPVETFHRLSSLEAIMITGNSDTNLIKLRTGQAPKEWHDSLQFALLRWADKHIDNITFDLIQSLPQQRCVRFERTSSIRVVHGSARNQYEEIFPDRDPEILHIALSQIDDPVFVCGHTHIPWKVELDGRLAFNPGAVCGPLNGQVCAQYAILSLEKDDWRVEHRTVEYDLNLIRSAFHESGLLHEGGALARSFLRSIETGKNVAEWFLHYAYRMAKEAGFGDLKVVPDEIWERADEAFDWEVEV